MIGRLYPAALAAGLLAGLLALAVLAAAIQIVEASQEAASMCGQAPAPDATPASAVGLAQIPGRLIPLYQTAAATYGLGRDGWAWLAAVNRIESDFGRDTTTSSAGAVGWMQFEPGTWATYGVDGDGDGRRDPNDPADAIPAAARYLSALGAPAAWQTAIRAYNGGPANAGSPSTLAYWQAAARDAAAYLATPSPSFPATAATPATACTPCPPAQPVDAPDPLAADAPAAGLPSPRVTPSPGAVDGVGGSVAGPGLRPWECDGGGAVPLAPGDQARIGADGLAAAPAAAPPAVRAMIAAGNQLIGRPYVYGGGHADFRLAAGYDCSSSVSWALHAAGFLTAPEDSSTLEGFGSPGAGLWVTVYANPGHVFVYIAGIRLDTSPQAGDGRLDALGPRWRPATRSTAGFVARHPTGL